MNEKVKIAVGILLGAGSILSMAAARHILKKNKEEELIEYPFDIKDEAE